MPDANVVTLNPARLRSWVLRLPFTTRCLIFVILVLWPLSFVFHWIYVWAALIPSEVSLLSLRRLGTYPFVHDGFLHMLLTLLALVPFLERFEAEHGSIVTLALFCGPLSQLPAIIYVVVDHDLFRKNTTITGGGVWVFLLLACESIKTYRANPSFTLGPYRIPTFIYPPVFLLIAHFLATGPGTSIVANSSGCLIGYAFELGYLKFLIPPEKILRWAESKLNLLGRLPHYVSVDQKTFGRYGVLPSSNLEAQSGAVGSSVRALSPRAFAAATAAAPRAQ